jgi:hypothetical protein
MMADGRCFYVRYAPHGEDGNFVYPPNQFQMRVLDRIDPYEKWEHMPRTVPNIQRAC